jgi:hypothetical protein
MEEPPSTHNSIQDTASGWFEEEVKMMTVYWASTYFVKLAKREEFISAMKKQKEHIAKHRQEFKEIKSWRLYTQVYGGTYMSFIDIWEYDSQADLDKYEPEWAPGGRLAEFGAAYMNLVEGETMSSLIWKPELELTRS